MCPSPGRLGWALSVFAALVFGSVLGHSSAIGKDDVGGLLRPPPGGAPALKKVRAVVVEQTTTGLPGPKGARTTGRQVMAMDASGRKLFMQEYRQDEKGREYLERFVLVRMDHDRPVIYSIAPSGRRYVEHPGDMNDLQRDRLIVEENQRTLAERLTSGERKQFYSEHPHLSPDGKRRVTVQQQPGSSILERQCKRYVVNENDLTVLDVEIAEDIVAGASVFPLYQRLGAFSEEVLEKLREVEGVPLRGTITVVTALPKWTLQFEVLKLVEKEISESFFELPPGAEKFVPEEVSRDCPMQKVIPNCKKRIEDPETAFRYRRDDSSVVLLCGPECGIAYANTRIRRGPKGSKPVPGR